MLVISTHQPTSTSSSKFQVLDNQAAVFEDDQYVDLEVGENSTSVQGTDHDTADGTHESGNPELGLDDHRLEDWEDVVAVTQMAQMSNMTQRKILWGCNPSSSIVAMDNCLIIIF